MAYNTFNPIRMPSTANIETEIKILSNDFGDGYSQTVADGLNAQKHILTLNWENLTLSQYKSIHSFFESQYAKPFYYKVPDLNETLLFSCVKWSHSYHDKYIDLSAELKQIIA